MVNLEIDLQPLNKLGDDLERFSEQVTDIAPLAQPTAAQLYQSTAEQILSQGARGGTPYGELSPEYEKEKAKKYPGKPINVRTGALFAALTGANSNNSLTINNTAIELSVDLLYAALVQEKRPLVALTVKDAQAIAETIADNSEVVFQRIVG